MISAASGISGAGRGGGERLAFVTVDENFSPYAVEGHRHAPEIAQELGELGSEAAVSFVPHLLPLDQGLLASCYVGLTRERGRGRAPVRCTRSATPTSRSWSWSTDRPGFATSATQTSAGSMCRSTRPAGRSAFAAIDNLWKGAAGQAIQNLNLMLGFPEAEGLQ